MNSKKRVLVLILIVLTVVLGGSSIFLAQLLQQGQAPESSSADVISTAATSDMYPDLYNALSGFGCNGLLSESSVNALSLKTFTELTGNELTFTEEDSTTAIPVKCNVVFSKGGNIDLTVHTFTDTPKDNLETRTKKTNANISSTIKEASVLESPYTYGIGSDNGTCQVNIFHKLNHFDYISLTFNDFTSSCSTLETLATQVTYVVAKAANNITLEVRNE